MIPQTAELTGDIHEDFLDELLLEEEQAMMIEGNAKVVDVTPAIDTGAELGRNRDIVVKNVS